MRAILLSLLLLLVCGSRDLTFGSNPGVIRLFSTGYSVVDIQLYPYDGVLTPQFNSSITNYTIDLTMCNREPPVDRVNWNCSYNLTVVTTSGVTVNGSTPGNTTRFNVTLFSADVGQPKLCQLTVTNNTVTYDYFVTLILHPYTAAGLIAVNTPGSFIDPAFPDYSYPWAFLVGLNSSGNTIQVNPVVSPGATFTFTGIPSNGAVQVNTECTPIPFTINVLAEDRVTTNNYSFSAFKPRQAPLPDEGSLDVELATFILNGTVAEEHQSDIEGWVEELANLPPASVVVYKLSVLEAKDTANQTIVTVIFLPGACGDPLSTQQLAWRFHASDWVDALFSVQLRDGSNQTVSISQIVDIVNSTQMLYCLNAINATVYGPQMCAEPEKPAKKRLSAEQGVAVATGVLVFIFLVVLIADSIHHKMNKLQEPTNELELRERTSMKDREPSTTSPQSPSAATSPAHEDP